MNTILKTTLILVLSLGLFHSCKDDDNSHGCTDSTATNYKPYADIDNNSCCYDCYYGTDNAYYGYIGEYCNREVELIENEKHERALQWHKNSSGETVFPHTTGAIPQFDAFGDPIYIAYQFDIDCGISPDTIANL